MLDSLSVLSLLPDTAALSLINQRLLFGVQAQAWIGIGNLGRAAGLLQQSINRLQTVIDEGEADLGTQRDLSVSHNKIGDVRVAQGDLPGALQAFAAALGIREHLAAQDPDNAQWQRDLVVSHVKLAEVAEGGNVVDVARLHYAAALEVVRMLAESGRLAPRDAWLVNELEARLGRSEEEYISRDKRGLFSGLLGFCGWLRRCLTGRISG